MVKSRTSEGKVENKTIEYLYLVIVKKCSTSHTLCIAF